MTLMIIRGIKAQPTINLWFCKETVDKNMHVKKASQIQRVIEWGEGIAVPWLLEHLRCRGDEKNKREMIQGRRQVS